MSPCYPWRASEPNYLVMACTSANVSYNGNLDPAMLVETLMTGTVPAGFGPHLRVVFDEVPLSVFNGMVRQICSQSTDPDIVLRHVRKVGETIKSARQSRAELLILGSA